MKTTILAVLMVLTVNLFSQVYIDPTYTGVSDGTINKPLKEFPTTESTSGAILIKSGTTLVIPNLTNHKGLISTYGTGAKPIVKFTYYKGFRVEGEVSNIVCIVDIAKCGSNLSIKGKVTNCDFIGGYPAINVLGNTTIKGCNITKYRHDGINSLITYDSLTIIDTKISDAYMGDELTKCTYLSSTDNIHIENVPNVILDGVYSDHSQFGGKFALIVNNGDKISVKNSVLIGHYLSIDGSSPATIYLGYGGTMTMENSVILGGYYGIQNYGHIIATNCVFKYNRINSIYQGGNKTLTNCSFVNSSGYDGVSGVIRSWDYLTTIKDCIFLNCKIPHQLTTKPEYFLSTGNIYDNCGRNYDVAYSKEKVNFIDTIRYNNTTGKGANITIDIPILTTPIIPDYSNLINELNYYKKVYDITMKGLLNKYQTKASIIKQINKIPKH